MRKPWRPEMPALLPPARMRQCSGLSRSFLRGPDGPRGASTWTTPALWRSYRAKETAGQNKIRITKVSTLPGEPRPAPRLISYYWREGGPGGATGSGAGSTLGCGGGDSMAGFGAGSFGVVMTDSIEG